MLRIWHGEDTLGLREALQDLRAGLGPPEAVEANTTVLQGPTLDPEALRSVCYALPFLAERRLVVVEGFLTARGRRMEPLPFLEDLARRLPETTELLFLERATLPGEHPVLKALAGRAEVRAFPLPTGVRLLEWTRRRAQGKGVRFRPGVLEALVEAVGPDLWALDGELEKLALYAGDREVTMEDLQALVVQTREPRLFTAVDALLAGDGTVAQREARRLIAQGTPPMALLAMLERQVRTLLLLQEGLARGLSEGEAGRRAGLSSEYALRRALQRARRVPRAHLLALHRRLVETDLAVKTGALPEDLALELLVAESAFPPPTRQAGSGRTGL